MHCRLIVSILLAAFLCLGNADASFSAQPPSSPEAKDVQQASPKPLRLSAEELYAKVAPAVVTITARNEHKQVVRSGSGFFLDSRNLSDRYVEEARSHAAFMKQKLQDKKPSSTDGGSDSLTVLFVVTNYHVIEGAVTANIEASAFDMPVAAHKVVIEDAHSDLAVLQLFVSTSRALPKGLVLTENVPPIGRTVYAIGNPLGLTKTFSDGLVSGIRSGYLAGTRYLQTTTPISPGSSGGPLIDADGRVVGITTSTRSEGQNVNFVVSVGELGTLLRPNRRRQTGDAFPTHSEYASRYLWEGTSLRREHDEVIWDLDAWSFVHDREGDDAISKGLSAWRSGKYEVAIDSLERGSNRVPRRVRHALHYLIGNSYFYLVFDDDSPTSHKLRLDPRLGDAISALQMAVQLKPQLGPAHNLLKSAYSLSGNHPAELLAADAVVRSLPRWAMAYLNRAGTLSDLGDTTSAAADLLRCIDLDPRNELAYANLAVIHRTRGEYSKAIDAYQSAIRESTGTLVGGHHYWLARSYEEDKQYKLAVRHYRESLLSDSASPDVIARITKCLERLNVE